MKVTECMLHYVLLDLAFVHNQIKFFVILSFKDTLSTCTVPLSCLIIY